VTTPHVVRLSESGNPEMQLMGNNFPLGFVTSADLSAGCHLR